MIYAQCLRIVQQKQKNTKIQRQETGDFENFHQNKKDVSQFHKTYSEYKDLPKRTAFEKVLLDQAFPSTRIPKYHWI